MAHPIMFDDTDPVLGRLRTLALAYPDAAEKISHGHPAFYTTKVFAYFGGSVRVDGTYRQHERSVVVLLDPDERAALLSDPRCYVPAYLGPAGWLGLDLPETAEDEGWGEVDELLDASYRRTAGPRRVARLDARPALPDAHSGPHPNGATRQGQPSDDATRPGKGRARRPGSEAAGGGPGRTAGRGGRTS